MQTALAHAYFAPTKKFPVINTSHLSAVQKQIIQLNQQQYAKKPVSYDQAVLTYTQRNKEAWCADYVSWIFKQAGEPFTNPNSISWRILGVYTLQAYFKTQHRYESAGAYQPKVGDVAIYGKGQGHTAIVLGRQGNTITTIGGNEDGHLQIDTRTEMGKDNYDLLGFGVLLSH